jgi:hypothetical protein
MGHADRSATVMLQADRSFIWLTRAGPAISEPKGLPRRLKDVPYGRLHSSLEALRWQLSCSNRRGG